MRWLCILGFWAFSLIGTPLSAGSVQPERAASPVPEIPVAALTSSFPPQGPVWVHATILEQTGDDTFLIKDRTGQILLFLPTDNLLSLDLRPGIEIVIYGTVDVNPVRSEKNEFYAERILLPPKRNL
jgi:uncharacterized protein YdeI (BOF family)